MTLNTHTITPDLMYDQLTVMHQLLEPVFLWGSAGCGKSSTIKLYAKKNNLKLYDLRLTQMDAQDLKGLSYLDETTKRTINYLPTFLPQEGEVEGMGYSGSIILLDELPRAEPRLQNSAFQLILDRSVGTDYILPKSCWVVAAGNEVGNGNLGFEVDAALADRFTHFNVISDSVQWVKWASKNNVHPQVITFIKIKPQYLSSGDGEVATGNDDDENLIKPTPRSWEKVSNVLHVCNDRDKLHYIIPGIVGKIAAAEFFHVLEELSELPPIEELLKATGKKLTSMLPTSIAAMYGLTYSLHGYCTNLEDSIAAVNVLNTLASIEDDKPRVEIQTLGVELLLENVVYTDWMPEFLSSTEYKSYRTQSKELVDLLVKNKGARK